MQLQPARMQLVYVSRHEAGSASVVPSPVCAYETVTVSRIREETRAPARDVILWPESRELDVVARWQLPTVTRQRWTWASSRPAAGDIFQATIRVSRPAFIKEYPCAF